MYKAKKESNSGRPFSRKTAVFTCIVIAVVFLGVINLCRLVTDSLLTGCTGIIKNLVSEGLAAVFALLLLKNTAGFSKLQVSVFSHLGRIVKAPVFPAFLGATVIQVFRAVNGHAFAEMRSIVEILSFVFFVFFVGIAEEAVFRGVIAESMLCTFGSNEDGRHFAALVSGVVFGMAHLQNVIGADVVGVLVQSVGASVVGILFAEVYFTFRSLKTVIILHAGIDFFAALEFGLFENVSLSQIVSTYSLWMIIPYAVIFMAWLGYCRFHSASRTCTEY